MTQNIPYQQRIKSTISAYYPITLHGCDCTYCKVGSVRPIHTQYPMGNGANLSIDFKVNPVSRYHTTPLRDRLVNVRDLYRGAARTPRGIRG